MTTSEETSITSKIEKKPLTKNLRRKFGMTYARYKEILSEQNGGCAICKRTPKENKKMLAVDHDHVTGKNRGILCASCNICIGFIEKKNLLDFSRIIAYHRQYKWSNDLIVGKAYIGYMHITNLYHKDGQDILMFKECYAMEKIHGTSAHLKFQYVLKSDNTYDVSLTYFSGGTKHETFKGLFNETDLIARFTAMALPVDKELIVYGESYGGKEQGMSETYGKTAKFIVFDVQINDSWLDVPKAEKIALDLGLGFVHYVKVSTDLAALDEQRDAPSVQAIRNGISMIVPEDADFDCPAGTKVEPYGKFGDRIANPKMREGVVLRPLIELTKNNGARIICKHKRDEFRETKTPRPVVDPAKMQVIADAEKVADDFVTHMRLVHVLDKLPGHSIEMMRDIIAAMVEDVNREGQNEFVPSEAVNKAIGKKTALMYKEYLKSLIGK